jgi:multicomponent Na+:H+ antiporter subunit D
MSDALLRQILSYSLAAPVIFPLLGAMAGAITVAPRARRVVSFTTLLLTLGYVLLLMRVVFGGGALVLQLGNWAAPYGISFVADGLSVLMLLMSCVVGLAVLLYSYADADEEIERFAFHPLLLVQLMGVHGAFLAGDIFNLYVWFEVLLTASFGLLCVGSSRAQLQAGIPYLVMNLMSSTMFLIACGLLYGLAGTLNIAQLAERLATLPAPGASTVLAMLFLLGYAIKAGTFPLFSWLPVSYHTPPVAVTALFSALMTKVGVYALIRIFPLVFPDDLVVLQPLIFWAAGLTMLVGVLGALAQYNVRRLLAFHIISQVGYLLMGFAVGTAAAIAATALFIVHVSLTKAALFMIGGVAERDFGTPDLRRMGGLVHSRPGISVLFGLAALALAGIPPLSGFVAKLTITQATMAEGHYVIALVGLGVSLLTLLSMLKIWNEAFWKSPPTRNIPKQHDHAHGQTHDLDDQDGPEAHSPPRHVRGHSHPRLAPLLVTPIVLLVGATVLIGLFGEPLARAALQAGHEATDVPAYVQLVLGPSAAGGLR